MSLPAFIKEYSPDYIQRVDDAIAIEEEVELDDEIEVKRIRVTDTMKILIRYHAHQYDVRGNHHMFRYQLASNHLSKTI